MNLKIKIMNTPPVSNLNASEIKQVTVKIHIWKLKESKMYYTFSWNIINKARPFSTTALQENAIRA